MPVAVASPMPFPFPFFAPVPLKQESLDFLEVLFWRNYLYEWQIKHILKQADNVSPAFESGCGPCGDCRVGMMIVGYLFNAIFAQ